MQTASLLQTSERQVVLRDYVRPDSQSPGDQLPAAPQMTCGGVEIVPFAVDIPQAHVVGRAVHRIPQPLPSRHYLGRFLVGGGGRPQASLKRPQPREGVDAIQLRDLVTDRT